MASMRTPRLPFVLFCVGLGACSSDGGAVDLATGDLATGDLATAATLTSITIVPAAPKLLVDDTQLFVATGTYSDATTKPLTAMVTWTSSSPAVATISAAAVATAVAAGTTSITASLGEVTSAPATVAVRAVATVGITWPGGGATANASIGGATLQFTATAQLSDGDALDVTQRATWSSSMTTIATIGTSGLAITGNNGGTSTISATFAGKTGTATMLVQ